jgi:hypothetical protein
MRCIVLGLTICSLALPGCSSGGSNGGGAAAAAGSGGATAGSGGTATGGVGTGGSAFGGAGNAAPTGCEPTDLDLASASGPGLSLLSISDLAIDQPTTIFGQSGFESAPIGICVPDDAVSLVVYGDLATEVLITSYVASGLGEIVDASSLDTLLRVETPDLMLPKSPELPLVPGHHSLKLAAGSAFSPGTVLGIRRGQRGNSSGYALNLVLVDGSGIDETNVQAFSDASAIFDSLYAQVGIQVGSVGLGFIHDPALATLPEDQQQLLTQANIESSPELPMLDNAINFYFVRELLSQDQAGTLLGHAMGIPGVPGLPSKNGVVLSVDAHRNGANLDFNAMWTTAAHEGGHWHGLRHTSERTGLVQDLVGDTPECGAELDANHDGYVDMGECAGTGSSNLMFWIYDFSMPPTEVSPGQGFALNSGLIMQPL